MTDQPPKLPRKPFGYDPSVVDQLLADRDSMLALAERRVREAEGKVARLQEQVGARDAALAELKDAMAATPATEPVIDEEPEPEPLTPRFMTEELAKIIMAAEESTSQILARARQSTREQILDADRLWREVQSEAVRFAEWREHADAAVTAVQSAIEDARAEIHAVPERIQSALAAAFEAMARVDSHMGGFASASALPLLAAPSGLDEARARVDGAGDSVEEAMAVAWDADSFQGVAGGLATGPTESDWPSLDEPPALNGLEAEEDEDHVAAEASQELRGFQGTTESDEDLEDNSAVWGAWAQPE